MGPSPTFAPPGDITLSRIPKDCASTWALMESTSDRGLSNSIRAFASRIMAKPHSTGHPWSALQILIWWQVPAQRSSVPPVLRKPSFSTPNHKAWTDLVLLSAQTYSLTVLWSGSQIKTLHLSLLLSPSVWVHLLSGRDQTALSQARLGSAPVSALSSHLDKSLTLFPTHNPLRSS